MLKFLNERGIPQEHIFKSNEICSNCGGLCCKKTPCSYIPNDFIAFDTETIKQGIDSGKIVIQANGNGTSRKPTRVKPNGEIRISSSDVIWTLRQKGIKDDKPICKYYPLVLKDNTCMQLTSNGCKYPFEERPGVSYLVKPSDTPSINACVYSESIGKWVKDRYLDPKVQSTLRRLVKEYS